MFNLFQKLILGVVTLSSNPEHDIKILKKKYLKKIDCVWFVVSIQSVVGSIYMYMCEFMQNKIHPITITNIDAQ